MQYKKIYSKRRYKRHKDLFAFLLRKNEGCAGMDAGARQSTGLSERIFQVLVYLPEKTRPQWGRVFLAGAQGLEP